LYDVHSKREATMLIPFKHDPAECTEGSLFATNVFDLLPQDHHCFVYEDIVEQLDTANIEQNYSVRGQNAYHPGLITGILIYAYNGRIRVRV
jgi:transposase